jgi:hypothetical protein
MLFRAALVVVFVLLSLFAWRGWNELPALARFAAALAAVCGVGLLLLRTPTALVTAALLTWAITSWLSSRRR